MATVILVVIFGILFSYFATINTSLATVSFGTGQDWTLPLYVIILIAISLGVIITYITHLIKLTSTTWSMGNNERTLSETRKEVAELTKQVHKLELENTKLRGKLDEDEFDDDTM